MGLWDVTDFSISNIEFINRKCHQRVHGKWCNCVLCYVECARTEQWIITIHHRICHKRYRDESVVRSTQLPVIFDIERIEVCMTSQTLIVRHIRQYGSFGSTHRTIHMTLDSQVVCRWRQFKPWSLTKTIHRLLCRHCHDQSTTILLEHWISHTLPKSSSIRGEAFSPFHSPQHRWTRRTCNNMWALIAHGV